MLELKNKMSKIEISSDDSKLYSVLIFFKGTDNFITVSLNETELDYSILKEKALEQLEKNNCDYKSKEIKFYYSSILNENTKELIQIKECYNIKRIIETVSSLSMELIDIEDKQKKDLDDNQKNDQNSQNEFVCKNTESSILNQINPEKNKEKQYLEKIKELEGNIQKLTQNLSKVNSQMCLYNNEMKDMKKNKNLYLNKIKELETKNKDLQSQLDLEKNKNIELSLENSKLNKEKKKIESEKSQIKINNEFEKSK